MGRTHSSYGENIHGLVGKPEGKTPLGRHRRRREDNINMGLKLLGWNGLDWINLAQDKTKFRAVVNTVIKIQNSISTGNLTS